ncbi:MAG: hypothetical protein MPJ24_09555 [Pirellulaceae bacterium]|nr:hypothetical protein [Pirellulaceae bacterium]
MEIERISLIAAFFSGFAACITAYATLLLYRVTKELHQIANKSAKLAALEAIENSINIGNTACLSSVEMLRAAESIVPQVHEEPDPQHARERFLTFIWLNAKQLEFFAVKDGLLDQGYLESVAEGVLKPMLTKPLALEMVRSRGYHPEFIAYCEEVAKSNQPQQSPRNK